MKYLISSCSAYKNIRFSIKISSLILLILIIIGCQNFEKKENQLVQKDFGNWDSESDSLGVELELNQFNTWKDLLKRTEIIACNDSTPKITLKTDKELKTIYFRNPCWEDFGCILIRQKNVIEIHNDTINKSDEKFYSLDSLESVIKRDFENNGKNPKLSDNPEKLLFYVSYNNLESKKLLKTLNKLTEVYERVTNRTDIKIWLNEKIYFIPPPPPPKME
jgi:hypothetical protein